MLGSKAATFHEDNLLTLSEHDDKMPSTDFQDSGSVLQVSDRTSMRFKAYFHKEQCPFYRIQASIHGVWVYVLKMRAHFYRILAAVLQDAEFSF